MEVMVQRRPQGKGVFPPWRRLLNETKYGYLEGILLGLGMTVRELLNSFLKRQLEIPKSLIDSSTLFAYALH
jgi:hypothetical protein